MINADGRMAVLMISHRIDHVIDTVDHLCIVNKDSDTFEAGPTAAIASPERLSSLYGRPITTRQVPLSQFETDMSGVVSV